MITKRIIPCLDVKNGRVVKGVNFEGLQDMADPVEMARYYNASGADELVFYDITASVEGRGLFTDILRRVASQIFIPLTVGGGINTLDDFDRVLKCGADKVSVNSGAIRNPGIIPAAAQKYGNQCVVLSADIKRVDGKFMLFAKGGRENTGIDALDWLEQGVKNGAGELVVNSIDTDGVKNGFANDFSIANWVPTMDNTVTYVGAIVYNLLGFELIGSIGSKIENPKKTVPKMTIIAGAAITFLYCFGTFGVLAAINAANVDEVDGFVYALQELCSVFGSAQMPVFYILIVLAISTLVANMITWCLGANESFQAAELDKRSKFLAHRSKKYGTSHNLYYLMGVISSALIILNYALSGNANDVFWTLFSFASIVFMLNYLFMFPAAIKLRFTDDTPRQYAVPGGKAGIVVCGVICFLCVALACYFLIDFDVTGYAFWMQLIGVLLTVAVGYWLYRAGKKKN